MAKIMKDSASGSLSFLKVDQEDGKRPVYITAPDKMDKLLRQKWGAIYAGIQDDNDEPVDNSCRMYHDCIYGHNELPKPPIS